METCNQCKNEFPAWLVNPLVASEGNSYCCPICALAIRNKMHGLPEDTPFHGETAQIMYEQAKNI